MDTFIFLVCNTNAEVVCTTILVFIHISYFFFKASKNKIYMGDFSGIICGKNNKKIKNFLIKAYITWLELTIVVILSYEIKDTQAE